MPISCRLAAQASLRSARSSSGSSICRYSARAASRTLALRLVDLEALAARPRCSRRSVWGCSRSSRSYSALAQRALGDLHFLDVEQVEDRAHMPAADDGAAVVLQAIHAHPLGAAGAQQLSFSQCSALRRMQPGGSPARSGCRPPRPRCPRAVGHVPAVAPVASRASSSTALAAISAVLKACGVNRPCGILHRPGHAARGTRPPPGAVLLAQDHLGGATADVDHQRRSSDCGSSRATPW
jgi:hypothetical protein